MPIKFGTYNIRNGRNGVFEAALRGMEQANMDLGVMQETKISDGVYTRASAGYRVVATDAPSRHRGGIALFYKEGADFAVEKVRPYGPNVISFEVVNDRRRWYIIGCYLAPDDTRTIERVVTALGDQPRGTLLIVAVSQCRDDPLYRPSVVGGDVTSDDVPLPPAGHQLKAYDVRPIWPHLLYREVCPLLVEQCYSAAVLARRVRRDDTVSGRRAGVNAVGALDSG